MNNEIKKYCGNCRKYNNGYCLQYNFNFSDIKKSPTMLNTILQQSCISKSKFLSLEETILLKKFFNQITLNIMNDIKISNNAIFFTINNKKFYIEDETKYGIYSLQTNKQRYSIYNQSPNEKQLFNYIDNLYKDIIEKNMNINDNDIFNLI